jgi:hypothetical protein
MSCAAGSFRSSATERLLRDCTCHQTEVPSLSSRHLRSGSPAPGGFDLDHVGAEIRQRLGRERPGDQLPKFEDLEAGKRAGGRGGRFNIWRRA